LIIFEKDNADDFLAILDLGLILAAILMRAQSLKVGKNPGEVDKKA